MKKKYLFFDIDGTLTNPQTREPVQSAVDTLHALKKNGHFVGFATGRPYAFAKEFANLIEIDNYVCSGGNALVLQGKLVEDNPLPMDEARAIIKTCQKEKVPFAMTIDDDIQMVSEFPSFKELVQESQTLHKIKIVPSINYDKIQGYRRIFISLSEERELKLPITTLAESNYHKLFLTIEPDDKYLGIKHMMKHINGRLEDVVVFGDGINDVQMFKQAPFAIAMGNAIEEIKSLADFITKDSIDDGVYYACKYFGWL